MFLAAHSPTVAREKESTREIRRLQELLEQRSRELEAANERLQHSERLALIGSLAAGIAHEINNPIGVIILAATNALEISGEPEAHRHRDRSLAKILNHCARIREIVSSVRAFASKEPAEQCSCSLNQVIQSAVALLSGYAKDRGVACELELCEPLPEIDLIAREMEQVFVKLICSAIEAGDRGTRVTIRTESIGDAVRGTIRDCGSSLRSEGKARQSNSSSLNSPSDGCGGGIGIAREIVASYGGSIDIGTRRAVQRSSSSPCPLA